MFNRFNFALKKIWAFIVEDFIAIIYYPVFTFVYRRNIWTIYESYHRTPTTLKKKIWNRYMELKCGSISIDAQISNPLILPHGVGGIYITQSAKLGKNVVVFQNVTIGSNTIKGSKSYGAPSIGDNVLIGAGAAIIGSAVIPDNCRVGANATVVSSVPANATIVTPPRIITKCVQMDNKFVQYLK